MTPNERIEELRRIAAAEAAERAVDVVMRAAIALLECAPLRCDAIAQRVAERENAHMRLVIELPRSVCIEMYAGDESIELYRRSLDVPVTFSTEGG